MRIFRQFSDSQKLGDNPPMTFGHDATADWLIYPRNLLPASTQRMLFITVHTL